eukprot:1336670-Amorphochlora_amoeboformis.AAC.1
MSNPLSRVTSPGQHWVPWFPKIHHSVGPVGPEDPMTLIHPSLPASLSLLLLTLPDYAASLPTRGTLRAVYLRKGPFSSPVISRLPRKKLGEGERLEKSESEKRGRGGKIGTTGGRGVREIER